MAINLTFTLPRWLHWLIPKRIRDDHDRRIGLTGKVSSEPISSKLVSLTVMSKRNDDDRGR